MTLENIFENQAEKPLDHIISDGGYAAIFRTICCIGNSLSSGEFKAINHDGNRSYRILLQIGSNQSLRHKFGDQYPIFFLLCAL